MEEKYICNARCWCEFCNRAIEKGEKFICIFKGARRGTARVNICRDCIARFVIRFSITEEDIGKCRKEIILESLG